MINDEDEWKINDILNFQCYKRWLQYQVKWKSYDNDLNWYNVDDDEFMNTQEMIDDFHIKIFKKSALRNNIHANMNSQEKKVMLWF